MTSASAIATEPLASPEEDGVVLEEDVLVVRRGPGANCSSIGSALDILFVTATVAGAILAAAVAALAVRAEADPVEADDDREEPGADAR